MAYNSIRYFVAKYFGKYFQSVKVVVSPPIGEANKAWGKAWGASWGNSWGAILIITLISSYPEFLRAVTLKIETKSIIIKAETRG